MFLNIVLTIILILLLVCVTAVIYWWFKHGREISSSLKGFMKNIPKNPVQNMGNGIKEAKNLFEMLQRMDDAYKNNKK